MKSVYVCFIVVCAMFGSSGCDTSGDNTVITDGLTADDYAKYEADLAAANSDETYEEEDE